MISNGKFVIWHYKVMIPDDKFMIQDGNVVMRDDIVVKGDQKFYPFLQDHVFPDLKFYSLGYNGVSQYDKFLTPDDNLVFPGYMVDSSKQQLVS